MNSKDLEALDPRTALPPLPAPPPGYREGPRKAFLLVGTHHVTNDSIHYSQVGYREVPLPENPMPRQPLNMIADVVLFHRIFGHPILEKPAFPSKARQDGRSRMINDEFHEGFSHLFKAGVQVPVPGHKLPELLPDQEIIQLADLADWLADMIYYLIGGGLEYGIPLAEVWEEVQRSNMAKLWSQDDLDAFLATPEGKVIDTPDSGWKLQRAVPLTTLALPRTAKQWIVYNEHGKVMKPPSWSPPDIISIIRKWREQPTAEQVAMDHPSMMTEKEPDEAL